MYKVKISQHVYVTKSTHIIDRDALVTVWLRKPRAVIVNRRRADTKLRTFSSLWDRITVCSFQQNQINEDRLALIKCPKHTIPLIYIINCSNRHIHVISHLEALSENQTKDHSGFKIITSYGMSAQRKNFWRVLSLPLHFTFATSLKKISLTISFYITNVRFIRNVATDLQLIIIDISKKLIYRP